MTYRTIVVLTVALVVFFCPAFLEPHHTIASMPASATIDVFSLIVEDPNGQMLGFHNDLQGKIADFATTKKRLDGATVITGIKDPAVLSEVEKSVNEILAGHHLPPIELQSALEHEHASCHWAMYHPKSRDRAEGFAGPGMLECSDAIVIGTTSLSERPIWLQRGLLMELKPEFKGLITLTTVPPQSPTSQTPTAASTAAVAPEMVLFDDSDNFTTISTAPQQPAAAPDLHRAELTWEQAVPYLSGIPLIKPSPILESPREVGLKICVDENNLSPSQLEQPGIVQATVRALIRFTKEGEGEGNAKLIVHHMKDGRFAVEELDQKIQNHLLELMREELVNPAQISSATGTNSN